MKKNLILIFFFIVCLSNAQIKNIYIGKADSIVLKTYSYYDKETSTVNDTIEKRNMTTNSKRLNKRQIEALNKKLKLIRSYSKQRALLSHSDTKILYYLNNIIIQEIVYSSITKNLTIFKSNSYIFKGKATPYLQKEINKLTRVE